MRLIAFSVEGYRRFVKKTSVKLHGDMVAFVGPNEAGKSSLLRALAHLNDVGEFHSSESPRRTDVHPTLTWHLQLEPGDKTALAGVREGDRIERANSSFGPRTPTREWKSKTSYNSTSTCPP